MADLYEAINKVSSYRNIEEENDYIRESVVMIEQIIARGIKVYAESRHLNYIEFSTAQATIRRISDSEYTSQLIGWYPDHPLSSNTIKESLRILKKQYTDLDVIIRIHPEIQSVELT